MPLTPSTQHRQLRTFTCRPSGPCAPGHFEGALQGAIVCSCGHLIILRQAPFSNELGNEDVEVATGVNTGPQRQHKIRMDLVGKIHVRRCLAEDEVLLAAVCVVEGHDLPSPSPSPSANHTHGQEFDSRLSTAYRCRRDAVLDLTCWNFFLALTTSVSAT